MFCVGLLFRASSKNSPQPAPMTKPQSVRAIRPSLAADRDCGSEAPLSASGIRAADRRLPNYRTAAISS
jgi:hypothetical protein